jgi:thiopeptide-type bacteriocin biosynthesis protein
VYRVLDTALVRAATHAGNTALPMWPDLTGCIPTSLGSCRDWLRQVWSHESYAEAIAVASPVLARQVSKACDGQCADPRRMRRTVLSVARYLLRMTGRSTPFGLFAGVAAARFGPRPVTQWGEQHRAVVRADATWLASTVTRLETCPQLLRRLPVVANNLCTVRGQRLILPFQEQAGGPDAAVQTVLTDVSVRHTRAVEAAVRYACSPIEMSDLIGKLAADFPRTSPTVIEAKLADLVRLRMLLTGLRPPMTVTNGLGHVVAHLRDVDADAMPQIADQVRALYAIDGQMARHNRATAPSERRDRRARLVEQMRLVNSTVDQPIMTDLHLDLDVTLPDTVARDAQTAAAVLTRLTPHPYGPVAWQEFHAAFIERYGVSAVVPLLELINPDTGLGFPATYRGSDRTASFPPLSERDRHLLALVQKATMAGTDEITLDDRMISDLASGATDRQQVPSHVELFVQIHAESDLALQRGEFTLVVTGAARAAGATTGRFVDLLDAPSQGRFRDAYAGVSTLRSEALPAQVSCPPVRAQSENVARAPAMVARIVSVGEYREPAADAIPLPDLAVGGDVDGLYLVSLTQRRLIEPTVLNAVEFRHFSQPIARFLCEVSRARAAVYMPFSWGAASSLPFLPRIRYGRTVLAPARWNLAASDLPGKTASWSQWRDGLVAWLRQFRMPAHVYLVEADNLLRLDLEQDPHLVLLRSHLNRHGHAVLDEAPLASAYGWLGGHAHEIAVPLTATVTAQPAPAHVADARPMGRDDGHLPGASSWLFAKLYSQATRHTEILAELAGLLSGWDSPIEWWYVPYRDPEPHLRVRIRLPSDDDYGPATQRLGAWAVRLRQHGLLGRIQMDTYYPETGRYGFDEAMAAAERVFAADSGAALAQRQMAAHAAIAPEAVTAASLVDLTIAFAGDAATGARWLIDQLLHELAPVDHALHATATRLADPRDGWAALRATDGSHGVIAVWQRRRVALADYRQLVASQRDPLSVLPSLLHMHHIRMFGIDPERERVGRRLARAAAQRWLATTIEATP